MAERKFSVTGDQILGIDDKMAEIRRQMRQRGGSPICPDWVNFELQRIVEGKGMLTEIKAGNILGRARILGAINTAKVWERPVTEIVPIRYREAALEWCAMRNAEYDDDWLLVYCNGLSFRQQWDKIGDDHDDQPCFTYNATWQDSVETRWFNYRPQAGYYLINFHGIGGNLNWDKQEQDIFALGDKCKRCHETIFSEAILSFNMIDGGRVAKDWYHWGESMCYLGSNMPVHAILVGMFTESGLKVVGTEKKNSRPDIRVSVMREWDF